MLERLSKAAGAELLSPTNLPEAFDWTAENDTLADSVFQRPEDGQLHLCESPAPEALVTDSLGRPIRHASTDLTPFLETGVKIHFILGHFLSLDTDPLPSSTAATTPCPVQAGSTERVRPRRAPNKGRPPQSALSRTCAAYSAARLGPGFSLLSLLGGRGDHNTYTDPHVLARRVLPSTAETLWTDGLLAPDADRNRILLFRPNSGSNLPPAPAPCSRPPAHPPQRRIPRQPRAIFPVHACACQPTHWVPPRLPTSTPSPEATPPSCASRSGSSQWGHAIVRLFPNSSSPIF